jgi:hypothetical protein
MTVAPTSVAQQACPDVLTCWADIAAGPTVRGGVELPTSGARAMAGLADRPYIDCVKHITPWQGSQNLQ